MFSQLIFLATFSATFDSTLVTIQPDSTNPSNFTQSGIVVVDLATDPTALRLPVTVAVPAGGPSQVTTVSPNQAEAPGAKSILEIIKQSQCEAVVALGKSLMEGHARICGSSLVSSSEVLSSGFDCSMDTLSFFRHIIRGRLNGLCVDSGAEKGECELVESSLMQLSNANALMQFLEGLSVTDICLRYFASNSIVREHGVSSSWVSKNDVTSFSSVQVSTDELDAKITVSKMTDVNIPACSSDADCANNLRCVDVIQDSSYETNTASKQTTRTCGECGKNLACANRTDRCDQSFAGGSLVKENGQWVLKGATLVQKCQKMSTMFECIDAEAPVALWASPHTLVVVKDLQLGDAVVGMHGETPVSASVLYKYCHDEEELLSVSITVGVHTLRLSSGHLLEVQRGSDYWATIKASQVVVGDSVRVLDAPSQTFSLSRVTRVAAALTKRCEVITSTGNLFAGGVLVADIADKGTLVGYLEHFAFGILRMAYPLAPEMTLSVSAAAEKVLSGGLEFQHIPFRWTMSVVSVVAVLCLSLVSRRTQKTM